jgi:glycine dehydrogenase
VYVELPEIGKKLQQGEDAAVIESVKAAAECKAPVSGTVVAVNTALGDEPGAVNREPTGAGWFFKMKIDDYKQMDALLDEAGLPQDDREMTHDAFARRHIGAGDAEIHAMLDCARGRERRRARRARGSGGDPARARARAAAPAQRSAGACGAEGDRCAEPVMRSFIGMGYANCHTPSVILRNVLENPAWYTAYTPYQPEISQGRLEALINFQTMVSDLTGMDIAECRRCSTSRPRPPSAWRSRRASPKSKSKRFFVDRRCHPQTIEVVRTRAQASGIEIVVGDAWADFAAGHSYGVLLQYPTRSARCAICARRSPRRRRATAVIAVACDLLALTLLKSPGELGADIAIGSAQRFGVPPCYGGPHAGFLATRDAHKRTMPGRLVGASIDAHGATGYRLALQTREQHIRREKATSNICTAQVLLAVIAGMYAVYHGPEGLARSRGACTG